MALFNMEEAVTYAENMINSSNPRGFFMRTEFGKIAVECWKNLDPDVKVEVNTWNNAPATKWALCHSNRPCDYHILISKGKTAFATHVRVIEAMTRCMLMEIIDGEIPEEILDAAMKLYINDIDLYVPNLNELENNYAIHNLNMIVRNNDSVRDLVRDVIRRRDIAASTVIGRGRKLASIDRRGWNPSTIYDFDHGYCRDMVYVIMYAMESIPNQIQSSTIDVFIDDTDVIDKVLKRNVIDGVFVAV